MKRTTVRARVLAGLTVALAMLAATAVSDEAFAVTGNTADKAYAYVVRVSVGDNRGCTGVLLSRQLVATSLECFQFGSAPPPAGPPPVPSVAVPRTDVGFGTAPVAIDSIIPRADRNLVLAHLSGAGIVTVPGSVNVAATAPADGETLQVLGFGRTAQEWVPDVPHIAPYRAQGVSATRADVTPAAGGSICKGDAGGPVLRPDGNGGTTLVGIVNTAWPGGCLGESETRRDATITRVDDLGAWFSQFLVTSVDGIVAAGTGGNCLIVQSGGQTYSLAGYDSSVVQAGANLHLTGFPAPDPADPCDHQGLRFQVTGATPILTSVTGTVRAGVGRSCLILNRYLLIGGDRSVLQADAQVQVTGYLDPSIVSSCQQGTPLRVLTAVRTG
jgi:hypothetical protein